MEKLVLYLIRHGKTEANEKHLYCGKSDVHLSENGIRELNDIKNTKAFIEIDLDEYVGNYSNFYEKPNYTYFIIDSSFITKDMHDIYDSESYVYVAHSS